MVDKGLHVSFTQFPPSGYVLSNLEYKIKAWKLGLAQRVPIVLCHFITCGHVRARHRHHNTELPHPRRGPGLFRHSDVPLATIWSHLLPALYPPPDF